MTGVDATRDVRRPGRPRSAECDRAIIGAALHEYAERGFDGMSVDAVAARAACSKATIYRRYPSKLDLVMAAAEAIAVERGTKPDTGSLAGDLQAALRNLRALLQDPLVGRAARMLVADAMLHDDLAEMHADFVDRRRQGTIEALRRAQQRGELRADADLDTAADVLTAPLFYRNLVRHKKITDAFLEAVIAAFVAAYGV